MKFGSRGAIRGALATVVVCLLGMGGARGQGGQAGTEQKPQMSEEAFKNVQVLRGVSVDQFLGTMGFFAASLSLNCTDCHTAESGGSWARYADDTPLKNTARRMVVMDIDQTLFLRKHRQRTSSKQKNNGGGSNQKTFHHFPSSGRNIERYGYYPHA